VIFVTVNLEVWNSLPESVQDIIMGVNDVIFEGPATEAYDMQNDRGLQWAIDESGIEVITLSDEETERWIEKVKPIQDEYASRMEAQGLPGREVLELIGELINKYR
jgi:TRAP-type C4-dicarboxylate transport system substrate-binding protein